MVPAATFTCSSRATEIIDATGWQPPTDFKTFRFGYLRFDSPARDVWMDDVVVASSRIGCL